MEKFKRPYILYPTDFSPSSDKAIEAAYVMEKLYRAEIILFHAVAKNTSWTSFFQPKSQDTSEMAIEAHQKLDEYRKSIDPFRMHRISSMVGIGKPETAIVEAALDINPIMIVMGHRGETSFLDNLFGTAAHHVLRHSPCPVLTLRKPVDSKGFKRILLPIDASKESTQKLQWGIRFANLFKAELHLFSVISPSGEDQHAQEIRMKSATETARASGVEVIPVFRPAEKTISETILDYGAEIQADMLCIMTQQESENGSIKTKMMGTVANHIVDHSDMAVMSILPERIAAQYKKSHA